MYTVHGINVMNEPCDMVGSYELHPYMGLLILGGGRGVWDDYEKAKSLFRSERDYEIMCVNDIGGQFKAECIEHIVSGHGELCFALKTMRHEKSMLEHVWTHSCQNKAGVDKWWNIKQVGGSSSLLALKIAIIMGYKKIIICGVPLDSTGHYFDPPDKKLNKSTQFGDGVFLDIWKDFYRACPVVKDRVRVLNSNLSPIFGEPTKEWVAHGLESRDHQQGVNTLRHATDNSHIR